MAPQDDLTAERADLKEIARKLVLQINEITPVQWDKRDDKGQAIILAALKTARQEALLEARLAVAGEMCDEPDHACGSLQRILDDIDRLEPG